TGLPRISRPFPRVPQRRSPLDAERPDEPIAAANRCRLHVEEPRQVARPGRQAVGLCQAVPNEPDRQTGQPDWVLGVEAEEHPGEENMTLIDAQDREGEAP